MLAKSLCLTASAFAYIYSILPPSSSKARQTDKITNEYWLRWLGGVDIFPIVSSTVKALETATYMYLMLTASKTSPLPAVQQLAVFKSWHIAATVLSVSGYALRKWSFVTLDRFFTVNMLVNHAGHPQISPFMVLCLCLIV